MLDGPREEWRCSLRLLAQPGGPPRPTEKRPRRLERPIFYTCHTYEIIFL